MRIDPKQPTNARPKIIAGKGTATTDLGGAHSSDNWLSTLINQPPKTKAGQVQWLWPQIKLALRDGYTLKQIWECLVQNDINLSYSRLRWYVARLRKLEAAGGPALPASTITRQTASIPAMSQNGTQLGPKRGALMNLHDRLNNRPGFEFDERPPDYKKLV